MHVRMSTFHKSGAVGPILSGDVLAQLATEMNGEWLEKIA
jgi:hypothetical protein